MELDPGRDANASPFRNAVFTVPNALSLFRGLLGPIVLTLLMTKTGNALAIALILMVIAETTDMLDGYIARNFNQSSIVGEFLDPICDTIYHLAIFMAFMSNGWMAPWMLIVIYARDLAVPYICSYAHQLGQDLGVRRSGKYKSLVHGIAQITVVLAVGGFLVSDTGLQENIVFFALLGSTAMALYSLIDYGWAVLSIDEK